MVYDVKICELLMSADYPAEIDRADNYGDTQLHIWSATDNVAFAEALQKIGAIKSVMHNAGGTPERSAERQITSRVYNKFYQEETP